MLRQPLFRLLVMALFVPCLGCARHVYEVDVSRARDFNWNGKLRIEETDYPYLGPFLMLETVRRVDRIVLPSQDSRKVVILTNTSGEPPRATAELDAVPYQVLGMDVWTDGTHPNRDLKGTTTAPESQPSPAGTAAPSTMTDPRIPLKDRLNDLSEKQILHDGQWRASQIQLVLRIEKEGLIITLEGRPGEDRPERVIIRDAQGRELRRFEREQIEVRKSAPE